MDNVKYIKQFLTENSDLCRMVCNTGEMVKLPNPYLIFRQEEEFGNTFKVFSGKTFITFIISIYKMKDSDLNYFEIREEGSFSSKFLITISDDENVFKGSISDTETGDYNPYHCFADERETCFDIVTYVKAGVQQYYHKKEEENNG